MTGMALCLTCLAVLTLLLLVVGAIGFARGNRQIHNLRDAAPLADSGLPRVSIIIAARNEERKLAAALRSVRRLDYPRLEIIAVNDRSPDSTGAILDRLAHNDPRLRPLQVTALPPGWLGKCHALHLGAATATGDWLLFTDADVVYAPDCLRRAIGFALAGNLDYLAVMPRMTQPDILLTMFVGAFTVFFGLYARPWRAREPRRPDHIGIGAFNLVRTTVYRQLGGHQAIALRPDDDLKLGKLKKNGCRQDIARGAEWLTVEWYGSLRELTQLLCRRGVQPRRRRCRLRDAIGRGRLAVHRVAADERRDVVVQCRQRGGHGRLVRRQRPVSRPATLALAGDPVHGAAVPVHHLARDAADAVAGRH
jgi:hypothetical protein